MFRQVTMKKLIYVQPRILFYQFRLSPTYPMVGAAHAVSGMPVAQAVPMSGSGMPVAQATVVPR